MCTFKHLPSDYILFHLVTWFCMFRLGADLAFLAVVLDHSLPCQYLPSSLFHAVFLHLSFFTAKPGNEVGMGVSKREQMLGLRNFSFFMYSYLKTEHSVLSYAEGLIACKFFPSCCPVLFSSYPEVLSNFFFQS